MAKIAVARAAVPIPANVQVTLQGREVVVKGPKGELRRDLFHPRVRMAVEGDTFRVQCELPKRREKALVGTFGAHVQNMVTGVQTGFEYKLKTVYNHFPIKVSVKPGFVQIDNFLGERTPRKAAILGTDTKVASKGDEVIVTGTDLEPVSQTAANIELATKVRGKDRRIFQDGIYITQKGA